MTAADGREKGRTVFSCVIINCVTALAMKYVVPFNEQCRQQQTTKNKKKNEKALNAFRTAFGHHDGASFKFRRKSN